MTWDDLADLVRSLPRMTDEERRQQCISLAYGNAKLSNPDVTREMVERAVDAAAKARTGGGGE